VLGAASSYLSQKVPNLVGCGGDLISSALSALTSTPAPTEVFTAAESYPCGIPAEVAQTGPNAACQDMYDAYKAAASQSSSCGSINVASLTQAEIPAACDEIRTLFGNGHEAAKLRKEHGEACYPNAGDVGPMGAADFGHQKAWCQIMRSMNGCVDKATDPRMQCDIDGDMSSFGYPPDCDNLLNGACD
jgi:hypothetical protein